MAMAAQQYDVNGNYIEYHWCRSYVRYAHRSQLLSVCDSKVSIRDNSIILQLIESVDYFTTDNLHQSERQLNENIYVFFK